MKSRALGHLLAVAAIATVLAVRAHAANPWADHVINYVPGSGIGNDFVSGQPFSESSVVLGEPTRITSPDSFPSPVSPVNGPFRSYEVVTVGQGGSLTVKFDEPVADDPLNPFGIDLLVFGNSFLTGGFFSDPVNGTASGVFAGGGAVAVSADGTNFVPVAGSVDGLFPTNAYADLADPFASLPGAVPSDFTRPVDPAFNPIGKTLAQIVAGYAGSGGGLGIDLAPTGLSSISFVRVTNGAGAGITGEIDAFADVRAVPEPSGCALATLAIILLGKTARRNKVEIAWLGEGRS